MTTIGDQGEELEVVRLSRCLGSLIVPSPVANRYRTGPTPSAACRYFPEI